MTTLSDQINSDFWANVAKYKEQHYQWMLTHKDLATHAVTLTFDPTKIQSFLDKNKMEMKLNNPYLLKMYKKEMKYFGRLLSRSLFGKSAERFGERLLLIPCLEGIEEGRIPHYHCTIGVDESRLDVTTAKIRQSWAQTRFCGQVRHSFVASDRTYGARRVWRDVLEMGHNCGLHRIERLMREQALRARPKRRGLPKDRGERSVVADNVLERQFHADAANQKWVADFTYIWTAEGWLYVAAVLDLYSRRIVGWSMQQSMTSQLVVDALMMAVWRRGRPVALLHHSDQGSQYTSTQFQQLLKEQGITCSMSRAGEVWDNSAMESFFSSLKTERTARKVYRSREQARSDVFDYIERFYNPTRRHSTLGYVSPIQFEEAQKA